MKPLAQTQFPGEPRYLQKNNNYYLEKKKSDNFIITRISNSRGTRFNICTNHIIPSSAIIASSYIFYIQINLITNT